MTNDPMTAKTMEDYFLADDLRMAGGGGEGIAERIDAAATHEEVQVIKEKWTRFFARRGLQLTIGTNTTTTAALANYIRMFCASVADDIDGAQSEEELAMIRSTFLRCLQGIGAVPR
jgi:hypothetical protein